MTMVNWPILIQLSQTYLGKSLTRPLDEQMVEPKDAGAFIRAIGHLESGSNRREVFLLQDWLLEAVDLSFVVVVGDPYVQGFWQQAAKLFGHGKPTFMVYKASVKTWREVLIRCCHRKQLREVRYIANRIFEFLDQTGLREVFTQYNKEALSDGTFELCPNYK